MDNKLVVAVVGGGPAGIMAAWAAAESGSEVILIEKNSSLGKKLLITGKGRCNITNSADMEDFIKNVPVNSSFLYSAFYTFTNDDLISLLNSLGLETKVERGGRVFPASDKSRDVLNVLLRLLKKHNVKILSASVMGIKNIDDDRKIVMLNGGKAVNANRVIIATGGKSYPQTGSMGDGYIFAKSLGHTIVPLKPSLVPIETSNAFVKDLMGLSLKNIAINVMAQGKSVYTDFGEMIFTHFGVSGPVILSASSHMRKTLKYQIKIDLKPALDFETLDRRLVRDFEETKNKDFINSLSNLLPSKLIPVIVKLSGIDSRKKVNEISRKERHDLVLLIKGLTVDVKGFRPLSEAIITSGGVCVKEINPQNMESKIKKGIFFAGEVIDVDAYTGGYNLQIAFSTGYLAGKNVQN